MRIQDRPTPKTTTAQCVDLGSTWEKAFKVMMANSARLEQERDHAIEALSLITRRSGNVRAIAQQALDEIERSKT